MNEDDSLLLLDYRKIKTYYYKKQNIHRYRFFCILEVLISIIKIIILFLFPFLIEIASLTIAVFAGFVSAFHSDVAWGIFSFDSAFISIVVSALVSVVCMNKKYFNKKNITLFFKLKIGKIMPTMSIAIFTCLYLIYSLIYILLGKSYCYVYEITTFIYGLAFLIYFLIYMCSQPCKQYAFYLRNTGILKRKMFSASMDLNFAFIKSHENIKDFINKKTAYVYSAQLNEQGSISSYFGDIYLDETFYTSNMKLLKTYLNKFANTANTDFDYCIITSLIKGINEYIIPTLIKNKQYKILKDLLISLNSISLNSFLNEYFPDINKFGKQNRPIKNKQLLDKYLKYYEFLQNDIKYKFVCIYSVLECISECYLQIMNSRCKDADFVYIKEKLLPIYIDIIKEKQKRIK